jgi:polyphosphate kinase
LAVKLEKNAEVRYAIIEIPKNNESFCGVLASSDHNQYVILIDDVIRHNLEGIFILTTKVSLHI